LNFDFERYFSILDRSISETTDQKLIKLGRNIIYLISVMFEFDLDNCFLLVAIYYLFAVIMSILLFLHRFRS